MDWQRLSAASGHALCEEAVVSADQMLDVLGPRECGRENNAHVLVRRRWHGTNTKSEAESEAPIGDGIEGGM